MLRLQDERGFEVNMILLALWVGAVAGARLEAADLARAEKAGAVLRQTLIEPLRRLRRMLKQSAEPYASAMRQRLLSIELRAERQVQAELVGAAVSQPPACPEPDRGMLARANLAAYLGAAADGAQAEVLEAALRSLMRCGGRRLPHPSA